MTAKKSLRQRFAEIRRTIGPGRRRRAADLLADTLLSHPFLANAQTVAAFASYRTEIPTDPLWGRLRDRGVRVLLPRIHPVENSMLFCEFSSLSALDTDRFGIRTPDGDPYPGPLDVVFVPGLAFAKDGARLGYGGGFYDRTLCDLLASEHPPALCGVCFEEQLVDRVPTDAHDVRLTHIATPAGVLACL